MQFLNSYYLGKTLIKPFVAIIFLSWFLNQKHMPKMRKLYHFFGGFYPPLQIFHSYGFLNKIPFRFNLLII